MSDRADAWMPLYIADYLRDTQHLSTTEHGAYVLLLMKAWTSFGVLPLDEKRLARIAGLDAREWKESRDVLLEFFRQDDDGFRHKRVDEELAKADANLEQRRAAGRASAAKRALQREPQRKDNERSTNVATEAQREPQRKGNSSPSPVSSLRSDTPKPPKFADQRPEVRKVLEDGQFGAVPGDTHLLWEWLTLPDMQLERDILPIVKRITGEVMATKGRAPFTFKLFDARIRQQCAEDEAEKDRLRRTAARLSAPQTAIEH